MLYEPSAVRTLWTLFILTWTSQLSLDSLCLFLSLKTSLFLLSFLSYITSSIYQAMNVSSDIYTSSLQYPAPLVFLILLFVSRMARGVLELKSSVIVNKLEIAANICSAWQNGLTQHLPQKSTVPDGRGPFPESRIWFMTGLQLGSQQRKPELYFSSLVLEASAFPSPSYITHFPTECGAQAR